MKIAHLKKIIRVFNQSGLNSLEINDYQGQIRLTKESDTHTQTPVVSENTGQTPEKTAASTKTDTFTIKAPFVGTFYTAPGSDQAAFVKVGDQVAKGQTVAIIEAMKMMNEVKALQDGRINDILVVDGSAVEYDQPLFSLTKTGAVS
ncbi:MAG: biotin/lipoyl-containing protein [Oenococcus sp.]|uniref:acetyl-CoA carboxylase biotin carboxyl carrier protein n=1 Tax=Oenococcus sp. TaxID=1979414 RepID=UPI0039E951E8